MWRKVLVCSLAMASGAAAFAPAAPAALARFPPAGWCSPHVRNPNGECAECAPPPVAAVRRSGCRMPRQRAPSLQHPRCAHGGGYFCGARGDARACGCLCSRRAGQFTGRKAPLAGKLRPARANAAGVSAMNMKKILVLGGDGFCGWPTTLHLASQVLNQPLNPKR
jgi:hypothetical protein